MVRWQAGSVMGNGSSVTNGPLAGGGCDGEWVLCH